ncbi:MAG: type I restriction enzyme HsdR N-terminal domain-containing protein [Flavobacteriales bacterium]
MSFNFPKLNLPPISLKIKEVEPGIFTYWDVVRKKYLRLTPEEWVRQHWVQLLRTHYQFPLSHLAVEKQISPKFRFDLLAFNKTGKACIVCEFKAPQIPLNQSVLEQSLDYNYNYGTSSIVLSNGLEHQLFNFDEAQNTFVRSEVLAPF